MSAHLHPYHHVPDTHPQEYHIDCHSPFSGPQNHLDPWVNNIAECFFPAAETAFLDLEGRAGYNLTRRRFDDSYDVKNNYDIAFYPGVGFRAAASDH
jgi:hypothetical protein